MTGMPGFGKKHDAHEIWAMILWIRHLAQLSRQEKSAIGSRMRMTTEQHEEMMKQAIPEPEEIHLPRMSK